MTLREFGLNLEAQIGNLIKKKGAVVGQLKESVLGLMCTGK